MKINSNRSIYPAAVMFACFLGSNVAYANSLSSSVTTRAGNFFGPVSQLFDAGTDNQTRQLTDSQAGTDSSPVPNNAWTSSASATVKVDYGVLKLSAASAVTNGGFSEAQSSASFADELTLSSPGLAGQFGILTANVLVSAIVGATYGGTYQGSPCGGFNCSAQTGWSLVVATNNTPRSLVLQKDLREPLTFNLETVNGAPGTATGLFTVQMPFQFGTQLDLSVYANANSFAENGTASAFSNLGNSIYWGGIQSVSFNGEVVPYSLLAASGTDWTRSMAPVPEPSTYGMLLAGVGMLAFVVRRRLGSTTSL